MRYRQPGAVRCLKAVLQSLAHYRQPGAGAALPSAWRWRCALPGLALALAVEHYLVGLAHCLAHYLAHYLQPGSAHILALHYLAWLWLWLWQLSTTW